MPKPFDMAFLGGTLLAVVAVALAYAALTSADLPIIGSGRGALIAVAIVGMTACAIGGISQAPAIGWTNPAVILGSIVGILALVVVAAGLLGWDPVLQPVAQFGPGSLVAGASTDRLAIAALAALITLKWLVDVALAASRSLSPA